MRSTKARAVLLDLDGVLRTWPVLTELHSVPESELQRVAFAPPLLNNAIRGAISDEEWRAEVARQLAVIYGSEIAQSSVSRWSQGCGSVVHEVSQLVSQLRPDIRVVLATNATSRLSSDLRALGLNDAFYGVANSSAIGAVKPETRFFEAALKIASVPAEAALFIDDSPRNVEVAQALGIRSHCFRTAGLMQEFLSLHNALAKT